MPWQLEVPAACPVYPHDHGRIACVFRRTCCSGRRCAWTSARLTAFFYGFRDRELVLDMHGRDHRRPPDPELQRDRRRHGRYPSRTWSNGSRSSSNICPRMLKEYDEVFTGNVIAQQRHEGHRHPEQGGRYILWRHGSVGPRLGLELRRAQAASLRRVRSSVEFKEVLSARAATRSTVTWCAWTRFASRCTFSNS